MSQTGRQRLSIKREQLSKTDHSTAQVDLDHALVGLHLVERALRQHAAFGQHGDGAGVAGDGADEGPLRPCSLPLCGQIPPARLSDISPT